MPRTGPYRGSAKRSVFLGKQPSCLAGSGAQCACPERRGVRRKGSCQLHFHLSDVRCTPRLARPSGRRPLMWFASRRTADACSRSEGAPATSWLAQGRRSAVGLADNLLDCQFTAEAPNQRWIADFTPVFTGQALHLDRRGLAVVAAVIDPGPRGTVYTGRIVDSCLFV